MIFAALALAFGTMVPKMLLASQTPSMAKATQASPPAKPSGAPRSVTLFGNRAGHYETDAMIGNQRISFLVDTGASSVALRESDAARIGIRPRPNEYTVRVSTANGVTAGALGWVSRIDIGDVTVHDVNVLVMPDYGALGSNLLGMTFLSRVHASNS